MQTPKNKKINSLVLIMYFLIIAFAVNPIFGTVCVSIIIVLFINYPKFFIDYILNRTQATNKWRSDSIKNNQPILEEIPVIKVSTPLQASSVLFGQVVTRLEKRKKYLHVALNSTLDEGGEIISQLPPSDRILIEVGTPLIKIYGTEAVSRIRLMAPDGAYIVADNKCADLAACEVEMMASAGANAAICLGVAPIEAIDSFVEECQKFNIDSMIDMMNVENALSVLKKLKKLPNVVMLHRGVDETTRSKEKQIPYYQIKQIKGNYDILVAVAGGDTIREIQQAIFNDADIVVVWKSFYQASAETAQLAESFLKEIK
jgi:bifunctional enzyme Fae/Hps